MKALHAAKRIEFHKLAKVLERCLAATKSNEQTGRQLGLEKSH